MSEVVEAKLPCPHCTSSDAYHVYDDGHGHCFSCGKTDQQAQEPEESEEKTEKQAKFLHGEYVDVPKRALQAATLKRFGYEVGEDRDGKPVHIANYRDAKGNTVAQKIRGVGKKFHVVGDGKKIGTMLFGQHLFREAGKRVIITEGEIDCLTVAQAIGPWPVVSLPTGAPSARKAVAAQLEWLLGFEEVVLWFDNDEPGRAAVADCVDLFEPGKVKVVNVNGYKDANEMACAGKWKEIVNATWDAKPWRPDGLVNGADLFDLVTKELPQGINYPWPSLTKITHGLLPAQLVTFTAGSGLGKSTIVREIAFTLGQAGEKVAYVALEESVQRTALGFVGLAIDKPLHVPGVHASLEDRKQGFDATLGTGNFWLLDHFGSLDPETLLKRLRYLVKGQGVKYLVLDHLSILVSGLEMDEGERRGIDVIMTKLRSFCEETGATLLLVSHLRKPQGDQGHEDGAKVHGHQLRGSHSIYQLSDFVIGAEVIDKDTKILKIMKNRLTGEIGYATALHYDRATGRLTEVPFIEDEDGITVGEKEDDSGI